MRDVSSTNGSISYGETSWTSGDASDIVKGKTSYKQLISRANNVDIKSVINYYNIDTSCNYLVCPFKHHQGGRETSGSFKIYENTNSFYCFGCKSGGYCCDFVSLMESIPKLDAAKRIINLFKTSYTHNSDNSDNTQESNDSKLQIMLMFSKCVRYFNHCFSDSESKKFIELRCEAYDKIYPCCKSNEALKYLVEQLNSQIEEYISCHIS
jgi:hypothetical protein